MATGTVPAGSRALGASFRLPPKELAVAISLCLGCALLSLSVGAAGLPISGLVLEFLDRIPLVSVDSGLSERQAAILIQIRLPRVVLGGLVGSALALSGAGYQGVFRNPLADPYLLGIAAGGGLGATTALVLDLNWAFGPLGAVQLLAFLGALSAVAVSMLISRAAPGQTASLLLAGIATAAFFSAVQTYMLSRNPDTQRSILAWLFGSLIGATWDRVTVLGFYVLLCGTVLVLLRRHLDVLRVGEDEASALGANPAQVRMAVLLAASLLTAAAVSVSGLITFVGLVVPHVVRMVSGSSYRQVVPLSAIGGAAFIILTDLVGRTIVSPAELGLGIVTSFIGAPFFAFLLWRSKAGAM